MNLADPNFDDFHYAVQHVSDLAVYGHGLSSVSGGSVAVASTSPQSQQASLKCSVSSRFGVALFAPGRAAPPRRGRQRSSAIAIGIRYLSSTTDLSRFHLRWRVQSYPVVGVMPDGFDFSAQASPHGFRASL